MHCRRRTSLLLGYFQLLKGIVSKGSSVSTPNHFATAGVSLSRPLSTARRRLPPPATRCPGGRRAPRPGPAPRPTSSRRTASHCFALLRSARPAAPRLPARRSARPVASEQVRGWRGGGGPGGRGDARFGACAGVPCPCGVWCCHFFSSSSPGLRPALPPPPPCSARSPLFLRASRGAPPRPQHGPSGGCFGSRAGHEAGHRPPAPAEQLQA